MVPVNWLFCKYLRSIIKYTPTPKKRLNNFLLRTGVNPFKNKTYKEFKFVKELKLDERFPVRELKERSLAYQRAVDIIQPEFLISFKKELDNFS